MTTSPFIETEIYLLANKDVHNNISIDSNMIVAINQTNANEMSFLKDHFPNCRFMNCNSIDACLNAVEEARADCMIVSNYQVTLPKFDNYNLYTLTTGAAMNFAFAVRRSDNNLYYVLNKTANLVPASAINSALTNYASDHSFSIVDFLRRHIISVIALTLAIAILGVASVQRKAQRKEQEFKDRMAIQNQMLENERRMHEVDAMISSVAADYRSVYCVDLSKDQGICYSRSERNSFST